MAKYVPEAVRSGMVTQEEYDKSKREGPAQLGPISDAIQQIAKLKRGKNNG